MYNKEELKIVEDWFTRVDKKITTNAVAKQFILEEIEGASLGNEKAQRFVETSGFNKVEYMGAMTKKSFDEVDGGDGPQQTLMFECHLPLKDKINENTLINIRLNVVKKIMQKYSLGKYSFENTRLSLKLLDSNNYEFVDKYKEYLIQDSSKFDKVSDVRYFNQETQSYIQINGTSIMFIQKDKTKKIFEIIDTKKLLDEVVIITEGKTDWKHIKKALNKFQYQGIYLNLNIQFEEYEDTNMGDAELDSMVRTYSKKEQSKRHIFIFDRDNSTYVDKYAKSEFNNHDNDVYSFCIPKISNELDKICIELYYKIDDLKTIDKFGRRIFIGDEFKGKGDGDSICGKYVTEKRNARGLDIIDRDKKVFIKSDIRKENNIALSKNDFTNNIINDVDGFDNFDIENFKLIFNVIEKIVND